MSRLELLRALLSMDFCRANKPPSPDHVIAQKTGFLSTCLQIWHNFYFFHLTHTSMFSEYLKNIIMPKLMTAQQINADFGHTRDSREYKQI